MFEAPGNVSTAVKTSADGRHITIIIRLPRAFQDPLLSQIADACVRSATTTLLQQLTSLGSAKPSE